MRTMKALLYWNDAEGPPQHTECQGEKTLHRFRGTALVSFKLIGFACEVAYYEEVECAPTESVK